MEDYILYKVEDGIAWITINRPEKRNRLSFKAMPELVKAIERAEDDNHVRVLVITGAGDKAFCAGGGLDEVESGPALNTTKKLDALARLFLVFRKIGKPSIAMINGYAVGGGCGLAMLPTFGIASENAIFGYPELKNGIWPMVVMPILIRTVGRRKGLELICTAELIDANEALKIGMVNRVVPHNDLKSQVVELADQLKSKSGSILRFGLGVFNETEDMEYERALSYLKNMAVVLNSDPDFIEGTKAFLEKRKPKWSN